MARAGPGSDASCSGSSLWRPCRDARDGRLVLGEPACGGVERGSGPTSGPCLAVPARPGGQPLRVQPRGHDRHVRRHVRPATWPRSALASKFDCFYVHPTDSLAKTANTGLAVTKWTRSPPSTKRPRCLQVCDVWAPAYRSQTWTTVEKFLAGDKTVMAPTFEVAYDSVLPAWQWFLAHTQGKPVILVGDSQGSAIIIHLISAEVDHEPSVLRRLLVAVIVGGNLQVPTGKTVGATFTKVPLCTSGTETGCAIAFSSYPSQPPADSLFGRPGQGTSLQSGQTAKAGQQVACVNPAALSGGTADLDPYFLTLTQVAPDPYIDFALKEPVPTPWVTYPELYSAGCTTRGRGHLAPGQEPRRDKPSPTRRDRQGSGSSWRYRPGVGLPRLRVRPHPRQPAP